jgi:hypothetical protein
VVIRSNDIYDKEENEVESNVRASQLIGVKELEQNDMTKALSPNPSQR